jgi:site-specific DNA-adenine methylase
MKILRPFFSFFGSKWRASKYYPEPKYNTIIEPFAGSAGYSLRHFNKSVILIDKDPIICDIWKYLVSVSQQEILNLPDVGPQQRIDSLDIPIPAQYLIGLCVHRATTTPSKTKSVWSIQYPQWTWCNNIRIRIANQLKYIRHWQILNTDYKNIPNIEATWFIDPPYIDKGYRYTFGSKSIDYKNLSSFCLERKGQIIVCEQDGAGWLPFKHFRRIKSTHGFSKEVVYT